MLRKIVQQLQRALILRQAPPYLPCSPLSGPGRRRPGLPSKAQAIGWQGRVWGLLIIVLQALEGVVLLLAAACGPLPGVLLRTAESDQSTRVFSEPTISPTAVSAPIEPDQVDTPLRSGRAQGNDVRFERISVKEGLSQSSVLSILQDDKGFMWFGTEDGLERYNGYEFTVYKHDPDDPHSLSQRAIGSIYEDQMGLLWIRGGIGSDVSLDRYDRETERFTHYMLYDADDPESASSDFVWVLYEDSGGTVWAGTYKSGLYQYDRQADRFIHYRHDADDPHSLSDDRVYAIYEDRAGAFWIGTKGGLNRLDRKTGRFAHYRHDSDDPQSLGSDLVQLIYEDGAGRFWITTFGVGLEQLDRETGRIVARYQHDPDDPQSIDTTNRILEIYEDRLGFLWIRHFDGRLDRFDPHVGAFARYRHNPDDLRSLSDNVVHFVAEDRSGNLWIGTAGGLDRYDRQAGHFVHYRNDPDDPHSLSGDTVVSFYEDRAGVLWFGVDGRGLDLYDPKRAKFALYQIDPDSAEENVVSAIYEDSTGALWVGTDAGLNRFDRQNGEWTRYRHDPDDVEHSLSPGWVASIYEDREGVLWIGTRGGLDVFDRATGGFVHYQQVSEEGEYYLGIGAIYSICQDRAGVLWLGKYRQGLCKFDRETGECTYYRFNPDDPLSPYDMVRRVYEDRAGTLWVGTEGGLLRFDRGTETFTLYERDPADPQSLSVDEVRSIYQDRSGVLWVGTSGGGLNRFDRETETFAHYTEKDGLPSNVVLGILEDGQGNLWLSTRFGLSRFDPHAETFRNYDSGDGLQGNEFVLGAFHQSADGEMFFGGVNGFNAFYPQRIRDDPYIPPVVLTLLAQGGEDVVGHACSVTAVESVAEVTFKWPNNFFEFEFAALSYSRPEKNRYAYKLEGFRDEDWNYIGTRRSGRYTNLPGGTYTLRIKGSNSDGVWNEEGVSVVVTIVPPFWETWWFVGIVALVLVGGAIGGYRLRVRNIKARSRELESQVANRTKELAAINTIATVVGRSLDLQQILADALDKTLQVMEIEAGGIYILDEKDGLLAVAAYRGFSSEFVAEIDRLEVGEGFSGRVAQSGEPLVVRDVSKDPRLTRMVVREEGLHSLAIAPLTSKGKVLGTLFAVTRVYREFSDQDVQLLTLIARQIGVAVENARFFESEQRRAEQFQVISRVGHHITSILDIDRLLQEIVCAIRDTFGYHVVGIGLIEGEEIVVRASAGVDWQDPGGSPLRLKVGGEGVIGWVAGTGQPLLVPDVSQEPRYLLWPNTVKTCSELAVPMNAKSGVIGVLNVESGQLNAFDNSDLMVLQSLANQAAIAIENARLFDAEQRRVEQFRVIAEVGRRLTLTPDVDELLVQVVRLVQQTFGYYHVGIGLIEGDEVVYRVGSGVLWDDPQFQFKPARLKLGEEGLSGWVAATGEPLLIPDVSQEPRYVWMRGSKTRSELLVPIVVKGQVIGVLDVQSDHLDAFDDTDLAVLQSLAHQTGAAIENVQLYEQAQHAAVVEERQRLARELHDAVTQTLFSASLIAEVLPALWERDRDEGEQLLEELRRLARGALAEMRTLLLELRPAALIETELADLLHQLAEAVTGREGLAVTVEVEGGCTLPSDVHVALYRIAQEALNNVVKHACAGQVQVRLRCTPFPPTDRQQLAPSFSPGEGPGVRASSPRPGLGEGPRPVLSRSSERRSRLQRDSSEGARVELCIHDDGRGFDPENVPPDHLGLGIMRERARAIGAALTIESRPGHGTQVAVVWERDRG